jgi:hypothetical protein
MIRRVRLGVVVITCLRHLALSAPVARAESPPAPASSKDGSTAKAPEAGTKTKGANKRRRPKRNIHEGDEDVNGIIYTK